MNDADLTFLHQLDDRGETYCLDYAQALQLAEPEPPIGSLDPEVAAEIRRIVTAEWRRLCYAPLRRGKARR